MKKKGIIKKSQAAMEFLMTYGWAILIVIIAIAALAYFGVLSPDKFLPEKCVISSGSGLFCSDFSASTSGIVLRLKNILNENIVVTSVETTDPVCSYSGTDSIVSDGQLDFIVPCVLVAGKKLRTDITITYKKGATGISRTTNGNLITKVRGGSASDENICQNANNFGLCDGLDIVFGSGYRIMCCSEHGLCCP